MRTDPTFIYFGLFMLNDCPEVKKKSLSSRQRCLSVCQIKVGVLNSSLYENGEEQNRSEEKNRDVRVDADVPWWEMCALRCCWFGNNCAHNFSKGGRGKEQN